MAMAERKPRKPTHEVVVLKTKPPKSSHGVPKSSRGKIPTPLKTVSSTVTGPCVGEIHTTPKTKSNYDLELCVEEIYTPMKTICSTESDYEVTDPPVEEMYTPMKAISSTEDDYEVTNPLVEEMHTPILPTGDSDSDYEVPDVEQYENVLKPHQRLFPLAKPNNYTEQGRKPQKLEEPTSHKEEEEDYEPVSVYENVCEFGQIKSKKKKTPVKPKPRKMGVSKAREASRQEQRKQPTREVVVLPTSLSHTTPAASGYYTQLKNIRYTPGEYEQTHLPYEDDSDGDIYQSID